jgi:hypothetical protein
LISPDALQDLWDLTELERVGYVSVSFVLFLLFAFGFQIKAEVSTATQSVSKARKEESMS